MTPLGTHMTASLLNSLPNTALRFFVAYLCTYVGFCKYMWDAIPAAGDVLHAKRRTKLKSIKVSLSHKGKKRLRNAVISAKNLSAA
eukprot:6402645-Ditylum_brightwellii.AAC.1